MQIIRAISETNYLMVLFKRTYKVFLFFILSITLSFSQSTLLDKKVSVQVENVSIEKTLKLIRSTYGVNFCYSPDQINVSKKISLSIQDMTLEQALSKLFQNTQITYTVIGNQIILKKSLTGGSRNNTSGIKGITRGYAKRCLLKKALTSDNLTSAMFAGKAGIVDKKKKEVALNELRQSYQAGIAEINNLYQIKKDCLRTENIKSNPEYLTLLKENRNKEKETLTADYIHAQDSIIKNNLFENLVAKKNSIPDQKEYLISSEKNNNDSLTIQLLNKDFSVLSITRKNDIPLRLPTVSDTLINGLPTGVKSLTGKRTGKLELYTTETTQANMAFKLGSKSFYQIFQAGGNFSANNYHWTLGYGIGTNLNLTKKSSVSFDLIAMHINNKEAFTCKLNEQLQLRFLYNYTNARNTSFFIGPTLNTAFINSNAESQKIPRETTFIRNTLYTSKGIQISNPFWIGIQAGIRF
jgi:hypothetical protein